MDAGAAEPDVRVGVAQDVEGVRVVEHLFVEVRRPVEHHHPLPGLDGHAGQLDVGDGGALEGRHRGRPADDLVGRRRGAFPLVQLPLVGVVDEGLHTVGDRVPGGLAAGDGQHQHEEPELVVGEFLTGHVRVDQSRDDIVAGRLGLDRGHLHGVDQDLHRGRLGVDTGELRVVVAGHLVGPAEELRPVLLRNPEQSRDRLQGQLAGDLLDEVAVPRRAGGLDDGLRPLVEFVAKASDGARCEPAGDDPAQPVVMLTVEVEQDDPLHVDVLAGNVVSELGQGGVGPAVVNVIASRHFFDVAVFGDDPVPAVVETALADLLPAPPHRRDPAQFGQLVDGQMLDIAIRVEKVEALRQVGTGHVSKLLEQLARRTTRSSAS